MYILRLSRMPRVRCVCMYHRGLIFALIVCGRIFSAAHRLWLFRHVASDRKLTESAMILGIFILADHVTQLSLLSALFEAWFVCNKQAVDAARPIVLFGGGLWPPSRPCHLTGFHPLVRGCDKLASSFNHRVFSVIDIAQVLCIL